MVLMVDGRHVNGQSGKRALKSARQCTTMFRPRFEETELVAKHHRLQSIHAIIEAYLGMNLALALPVMAKGVQARGGLGVVGDNQANFAGGAQVLDGVEAEAAN